MKLSIQTILLPGRDLNEKFDYAKQFGFDAVEIAVGPDFQLDEQLNAVQRASQQSGLPVSNICTHPIHDPLVPDAEDRARRLAALGELLSMADALNATGVVSVPVRPPHEFPNVEWSRRYEQLAQDAVETFGPWLDALPEGKAAVFLEPLNRYEAYFLNHVGQAVAICERLSHPRMQALADLFHMNIEEADIAQSLIAAKPHLGHVHIADNNRFEPGAGCMDFRTPFAALRQIGFSGYLSIECWSPDGPRLSGDPLDVLPRSVQFIRTAWEDAL